MAGLDTTTAGFDAALKEVYLPGIREQLNKKTRVLNDFTKADIEQLNKELLAENNPLWLLIKQQRYIGETLWSVL